MVNCCTGSLARSGHVAPPRWMLMLTGVIWAWSPLRKWFLLKLCTQCFSCVSPSVLPAPGLRTSPTMGCTTCSSFGSRLSSLHIPCAACVRLSEVGLLAPVLSAALPTHFEKPITSVTNWHRKTSLSRTSCCVLRGPSSPSGEGKPFCPWMFLNMPLVFSLPLSTWLLRNLGLFSHCFHLREENTTKH